MVLRGAKGWREPDVGSARRTSLKGMLSLISRLFRVDEDMARRVGHRHASNGLGELGVANEEGRVCH